MKAAFEILYRSWFQLACLFGVLVLAFLTVRTNRKTKKRNEKILRALDELMERVFLSRCGHLVLENNKE